MASLPLPGSSARDRAAELACATRGNSRMLYNAYIRSLGESGSMRLIRLLAALLIFGAAAQAQGFPPGRPAQLPPDTPAPPPHSVAPAQAGQQQTATTPVGQQQNPAAPNQGLPQSQGVTPEQPPVVPLAPSAQPPVPPTVTFQNGLLAIRAENSTLAAILTAVRARTGANVDIPAGAAMERVAAHVGPAPPRDVLASLLNGSGFDYIIVGSVENPDGIRRLILTPHQNRPTTQAAMPAGQGATVNAQPVVQPPDEEEQDDAEPEPPPPPAPPQPQQQPGAQPPNTNSQPNQVKTPQELLQELQRLQQQQQQQQQNPQGQQTPPVPHRMAPNVPQ